MVDNHDNQNPEDESRKWPPAFDTYGDDSTGESPEENKSEEPPAAPKKKSFLDHTSSDKEPEKPAVKEEKAPVSDKPSFLGFTAKAPEEKADPVAESPVEENIPESESPAEEFPWGNDDDDGALPWANEDETPAEEIPVVETSKDPEEEKALENLFATSDKEPDFNEPEPEEDTASSLQKAFFDQVGQTGTAPEEEEKTVLAPIEATTNIEETEVEQSAAPEEEFLDSLQEDPLEEEDDDDNPYRAYAYYDFLEQESSEESAKGGTQLSKQAIIFILVLVLAGGWFAFQKYSEGQYKFVSKRDKRKIPRKKAPRGFEIPSEKLPLWEITRQKSKKYGADLAVIKKALKDAGRDNPFAVPEAVLTLVKMDIEAAIAKEVPPEVYQKTAYRATLNGIVTSKGRMLAVVSLRTAIFDITEGTSKPKIIKKAIKEMNKTKDDSMELVDGDDIGPWTIVSLDDGRKTGIEAQMIISRGQEKKLMRIGVPIDLGIYNDEGELDVFKEAPEEDE